MKLTALAIALLLPVGVFASTYECTTTNRGSGGWIPNKIYVEFNRNKTSAKAIDGYINEVHGNPIDVAVKKRSDTGYELKWKLRNIKIRNAGSGILSHTLSMDTQKLTFRMRGRLHGYDNIISGSGTCKRR